MNFSRIGRSLSRSSRVKNLLYGDARLGTVSGVSRTNVYSDNAEKGLGFLRGYVSSAITRSNNGFASNLHASKSLAANPRLHRMFSSQCASKEKSISNKKLQILAFIAFAIYMFDTDYRRKVQINTFQEFENKLLEPGLVDHIVVFNESVAEIYVRNSPCSQRDDIVVFNESVAEIDVRNSPCSQRDDIQKYFIYIGSVESFKKKLKRAQEALGIDPHDFVPVTYSTYSSKMVLYEDLIRYAPTLYVLGSLLGVGRMLVKIVKRR